jgi:transmembrane sensor
MSQETTAMTPGDAAGEIAALWCIRLSEGALSEAEWAEFEAWLAEPPNADLFQDAASVWQASGAIGDRPQVIAMRTEALTRFRKANQRRWLSASPGWLARRIGYAAILLLTLSMGLYWYAMRPSAYATDIGERQLAVLDDGSRVSLDAVTQVKVQMKDAGRQVELLEGRAKFDVAKDPLRPFTVAAGDKLVVAVGTSFSVELIDGEVRVILYEGQVEVRDRFDTAQSAAAAPRRYMLKPGSELVGTIGAGALAQISRPDLTQSLSWEQGLINFDREPLASAVERMNRYSARPIRLGDPSLAAIPIDGMFKAGDLDAFVEGVTALHPVRRKIVDGAIVLEAG